MSFAIIKTGGKQYKVTEGDKLRVEKLVGAVGTDVALGEVMLYTNGKSENMKIGAPLVVGASVTARIIEQGRDKKKIVFKYSSKTRYRKKKGHRQPYTTIEITKITA